MRTLAIALTLILIACGNGERPGPVPASKASSKATLRLAILTDLQGQLEPCGCQSRPLGGIDRMATAIQRLGGDGIPTVLLAAGDLLYGAEAAHGHASGPEASQQDRWRAETLVEILNRLGVVAVNPGGADWTHNTTETAQLLSKLLARSLATPPDTTAQKPRSHIVDQGGIKVGLLGIVGDTPIEAEVQALRQAGAAVVVVLVTGERRDATRAARVPGVDFVISGGIDNKHPTAPAEAGAAHVLTAGRQGEGLLVVDLFRVGEGKFIDASPWSRERERQAVESSITELQAKITAWEKQPGIDAAALNEQRARLAALQQESRSPAPVASGNHFVATWQEIGPEIPRDPAVEALIDSYDSRVNQHNRVALADVKAPPPAAGQPHYVGSAQCQSCHQKAFAWWTEHPHGRAYATLQEVNKEFNLSCVGCHVTGYNRPGGSTVVQNEGLTNVGCESCHGPGSQHAEDPDEEPYSVQRVVTENVCVGCHNPEHSDKFEYAKYREKLLVPGHGMPWVAPVAAP